MTVTIPESVLWAVVWVLVLVLYPLIGLAIWCWTGRRDVAAFLGLLCFWPFVVPFVLYDAVKDRGWFWGWDRHGEHEGQIIDPWSRREVNGWRYLGVGSYRTTADWGSQWVQLGPLHVGVKRDRWALDRSPRIEERTEPTGDRTWAWRGNAGAWDVRCTRCGEKLRWHEGNGGQWLGAEPPRDWMVCWGLVDGPRHTTVGPD